MKESASKDERHGASPSSSSSSTIVTPTVGSAAGVCSSSKGDSSVNRRILNFQNQRKKSASSILYIFLTCALLAVLCSFGSRFLASSNSENKEGSMVIPNKPTPLLGIKQIRLDSKRTLTSSLPSTVNLDLARNLSMDLVSKIWNRYEFGDKSKSGKMFLLTASNIGADIWDILKYKFAKKALDQNKSFLMIFGGSSVTAGHDSYFRQSYPMIFKNRTLAIFQALGINLTVNNIAQGANNCYPYDMCYESMGGMDADFIGWEQSYNCGHDQSMWELTSRWAGFSKERGVVYFSASGAFVPDSCKNSKDPVPFSDEAWTEESANLTRWTPSMEEVAELRGELDRFFKARPSVARFMGSFGNDKAYRGLGIHGFNVWESNPLCEGVKDGKKVKGCTGTDVGYSCDLRFMTHEAALYGNPSGHGARHHPSRAFHMLRGEFIAFVYTLAMIDAIHMIEEGLKSKSVEELSGEYGDKLKELQPPMPKPKHCHHYHCEARARCYTDYMPHFPSEMTLDDILVGETNWTYTGKGYAKWSRDFGYLDNKPGYIGEGLNAGEIHFRITVGEADFIWVCGAIGDSLKNAVFYLDANAFAAVLPGPNGTGTIYNPSPNRIIWTKKTYMKQECKHLSGLPKGEHILSILNNATTASPKIKSGLTHVIMWP